MSYIAHCDRESGREQSVLEHLTATAELAAGFASCFGAADAAYRCGLLHDIGKYSAAFQRRIHGVNIPVDHATAGAAEAFALKDFAAAFCIAGHHGGIPDKGGKADSSNTLWGRLNRKMQSGIEDYSEFSQEVTVPHCEPPKELIFAPWPAFFYTRMLYSCLVDADWLDTERFMQNGAVQRGTGEELGALSEKLDRYVVKWWDSCKTINIRRCKILRALMEAGGLDRGLYTLTVPTGGGKTVSSMAFALRHAKLRGQRRIIYVIPYTSIIEQTQDVFEEIFGAESVVAHYANITYENSENGDMCAADRRRYLATENWDAPVILTTAVQFFESVFSNRSSKCRKLHNIADSVIIFDEAQMLPVNYLRPCVAAITELVKNYGCTAVLCTATQPALEPLIKEYLYKAPVELCPEIRENYDFFRRVSYKYEGMLTDEELAGWLKTEKQTLCVVNSRRQAQKLFAMLPEDGSFHLSTAMTAEHRRSVLSDIRSRLQNGGECRVISTSLIEAGVDVDFPAVWRAIAGLDSIIQAGGRCNRENNHDARDSIVHIFDTETKAPRGLEQNIAATRRIMRDYEDIAGLDAVNEYFRFLMYSLKDDTALDEKSIMRLAEKDMAFKTVADEFHLIESAGRTVYIPHGEGAKLTECLRRNGPSRKLLRKLGRYAVTVYERDYEALPVEAVSENAGILTDMSEYNKKTGLNFSLEGGKALIC